MDCGEVRRLLDQGLRPGTQTATKVHIGFHIARCPKCYDYYNTHFATKKNHEQTLPTCQIPVESNIQRREAESLVASAPLDAPESRKEQQLSLIWGHMLWYLGMGTLVGLCLLVVFIIVPPIISFLNIYDNVQAMYVPPATPTSTAAPTQLPPTLIVVPTVVPLPTAQIVVPTIAPSPSPQLLEPTVNPTPTHTSVPTPVSVSTPTPQPVAQIIPK